MTIFLSLFGWCFTLPAHILCFCPFDLPRCCESQWRSWHFKRASNPTQATVWDLCMGVSAKKLLQVTHHLEGVKIRTSNSLPLFLSCKRTSILTLKKDILESTKPTPNKKTPKTKKTSHHNQCPIQPVPCFLAWEPHQVWRQSLEKPGSFEVYSKGESLIW